MEYRQLGSSPVRASVVTFGAWAIGGWMWGGADEDDAIEAIRTSLDLGVTSIDTAPIYGYGKSEELVGRAIAGRRDEAQILTKFCLRWDEEAGEHFFDMSEGGKTVRIFRNARRASILKECEDSLRRLGTDRIDLYQCHWRDHTTPVEETIEACNELLQAGKTRAIGVSNFNVEEIETARRTGPLASNQPPYSMLNRGIEKDILPYCREHNIAILAYSPLHGGLLTGKFQPGHTFRPGDHRAGDPLYSPESIARVNAFLDRLRPIANGYGATLSQLVVRWTVQQPGLTVALVGARDAAQARENAGATDFRISDADMATIAALLQDLNPAP